MVVDANVDLALPRLPFGRDDEDAPRLAAAPVAAGLLGRIEGREQALREGAVGALEGFRHRLPDAFARDHVRLGAETVAGCEARRRDALRADVDGHASLGVEDRDLPVITVVVGGNQLGQRLLGALAAAQELEPEWPVGQLRVRLGRDDPDAGLAPGHHGAGVEGPRLDSDSELARGRVAADDRIGHGE